MEALVHPTPSLGTAVQQTAELKTTGSMLESVAPRAPLPRAETSNGARGGAAVAAAARPPSRKPALTLPELRSKAAFRACDRLMEHGVADEAQLWAVARVMSGEEYEQAAEERALAGKCGNPLCPSPPACSPGPSSRYRISTSEQSVYERAGMEEQPLYCGPHCAAAVKQFAGRLGSGALALDRFTAMYNQVQQQKAQQAQQGPAGSEGQPQAPPHPGGPSSPEPAVGVAPMSAATTESSPAAEPLAAQEQQPTAAAASNGNSGSDSSSRDENPGGIKSRTVLAPRLAVEQVEVKHIDSSAGQFGDFSRKIKPRASPASGATGSGSAASAAARPPPKGVLKKQSKFAAGTAKVPIMLAEVKERDPSMVAAETARSLPSQGGAAGGAASHARAAAKATAVEGYVPRAVNSVRQQQQRQRRVRFSDEVEAGAEAQIGEGSVAESHRVDKLGIVSEAAAAPQQDHKEEPQPPAAASTGPVTKQMDADAPSTSHRGGTGSVASPFSAPAASPSVQQAATTSAPWAPASRPVLVFDVDDPKGPLDGSGSSSTGHSSLSVQFGSLRVADSVDLAAAARAATTMNMPASTPPRPASTPSSSSIDIQRRNSGSVGDFPREWREVPQFYAHSPVGSSSSLAGSFASPAGSSNNLAAIAASSPPRLGSIGSGRITSPPGLPRPPSSSGSSIEHRSSGTGSSSSSTAAAPQAAQPHQPMPAAAASAGDSSASTAAGALQQAQGLDGREAEPAEPLPLTRRQAQQLQRAFPPLSAVLPPELQAALESDTESEAAESEDWMDSDDDDDDEGELGDELEDADSSDEDALGPAGRRSAYRIQLSFFGTLFTHLEAWVTSGTVELLSSGPDVELVIQPPSSPEVLASLSRCLAGATPAVLAGLQVAAPRGEVERRLSELLRTLRLTGPLPAFKVSQWQVVAVLLMKALSLERCPALRPAFETREGIGCLNRMLASLSFTSEEFYATLELLCPAE